MDIFAAQKNNYADEACAILLLIPETAIVMKNKGNRLQTIKEVISTVRVGGQEELLKILQERGFELTQATLSRDLKQLQIVKIASAEGGYTYVLPERAGVQAIQRKQHGAFGGMSTGFISIEFSGQLAVIKTRPGYAGGLAYDIDNHLHKETLGTIAGDDTILLVLREGVNREEITEALKTFIPNIK